jgi:26S proteasome regulatory subunit T5
MSSAAPPPNPPSGNPEKQSDSSQEPTTSNAQQDTAMDTTPDQPAEETWDDIPADIMSLNTDEILTRIRLIDNDIKVRPRFQSYCVILTKCPLLGDAFRNLTTTA